MRQNERKKYYNTRNRFRAAIMKLRKGAPDKVALAWWLRQSTTVPLRCVSERPEMGHYSRVTQAVRQMTHAPKGRLRQIRRKLEDLAKGNE